MNNKKITMDTLGNFAVYLRLSVLGIVFFLCVVGAFMTRYDDGIPEACLRLVPVVALIWAATQCFVLMMFGVHARVWSFTSPEELVRLGGLSIVASAISSAFLFGVMSEPLPRSIYLISALYSLLSIGAVCFLSSSLAARLDERVRRKKRTRVLIYGADRQGVGVLSELRRHCPDFQAVGFLGDLPVSRGRYIAGLRVLGGAKEVGELLLKHKLDMILVSSQSDLTSLRIAMKQIGPSDAIPIRIITSISDEVRRHTDSDQDGGEEISATDPRGFNIWTAQRNPRTQKSPSFEDC
jgi:FlaA1/EpsC-like NDP-sugar epimerase